MKKTKITDEEMEAKGILDNDAVFEGPFYTASDMPLEDFASAAAHLKKELASTAGGYTFTNEGMIAFLFWSFYQMGLWDGCIAYREELIAAEKDMRAEEGIEISGFPKPAKYVMDIAAAAGMVEALDNLSCAKLVQKISTGYPLSLWDKIDEDEEAE